MALLFLRGGTCADGARKYESFRPFPQAALSHTFRAAAAEYARISNWRKATDRQERSSAKCLTALTGKEPEAEMTLGPPRRISVPGARAEKSRGESTEHEQRAERSAVHCFST